MPLELTVVDAFTSVPFSGNPAAVAITDTFPSDEYMQRVATEMNLPETAFAVARSDGSYDLRWLTPSTEVDLCGHATLATTHVIGGSARFHTRSGPLECSTLADGSIEMDFPADGPSAVEPPRELDMPGIKWSGRGKFGYLFELSDETAVRRFEPDLAALAKLEASAVVITARGGQQDIDCVARVFAPALGIPEDPVTGAAHCMLAVFWGERLDKENLIGEQASERGGIVRMRLSGERVILGGEAVTISTVQVLV